MRFALIPVKELSQAKARLAPALDQADRYRLARALFRDVLAAARACPALDGTAVVSRDAEALSLASEAGAEALAEPGGPSAGSGQALNEALTLAGETLARRGASRLVVLAADLPCARPEEIAALAEAKAAVALVPSPDGGTNGLALPPGAIPFRFGPDSARRHLEAARTAGLPTRRMALPSLTLDIDTPEELRRLRAIAEAGSVGAHTLDALTSMGALSMSGCA